MLQNNPILSQLKKQLYSKKPRIKGVVKSTEKGYGFLESDTKKSYFIPPYYMKKVMHGDKIIAVIRIENNREIAEPDKLIEPFLCRFVGQIKVINTQITVVPDHPLINEEIIANPFGNLDNIFNNGDWVIAEMRHYPMYGDNQFHAEIMSLITNKNDQFVPWLVTLARYNLSSEAPKVSEKLNRQDGNLVREDLTSLDFITIDNPSTEDIDDALYVEQTVDGLLVLTIAIADPTAWIPNDSLIDTIAKHRAFTNYLPGLNIPMLPRVLSENLCSLRPHERRPALVCRVTVFQDGRLSDDIRFFTAWIESKAKLTYENVSDWLKKNSKWQPENNDIANQIYLLKRIYKVRSKWRQRHALLFKDQLDYNFSLDNNGEVLKIEIKSRCIANRIIEEAMITANICAARVLRDKLGFGLYNVHQGFDSTLVHQAVEVLKQNGIMANASELLTLEGFCSLRRQLDALPTSYLGSRMHRFQTHSEISLEPKPHFGLGLDAYATWTSPIRKYSDMLNHRLLKSIIGQVKAVRPSESLQLSLSERRKQNRMAERDVSCWLYARFLRNQAGSLAQYNAEIIDIARGGMRVRLLENGATTFIPASFIHGVRSELLCSQETGIVKINGKEIFRQGDNIKVTIFSVCMKNRSVISRLV